jgi:hypothetical protein
MVLVLDVYKRPFDARLPVICMDESPKQLIAETTVPLPASAGKSAQRDYVYRRCGGCNILWLANPWQETAW